MSQIFDALHQSQGGSGPRDFANAKELLQAVEERGGNAVAVVESPRQALRVREGLRQFPTAEVRLPEHSKFVCLSATESLPAEKFRYLATRLRHMQQKRSLNRLVVTSSVAGEGKSMVAANLACALAAGKQQVLLVEGDLRRPSLASQFGVDDLPGLSQVLQSAPECEKNIHQLEGSGLCILLAGSVHTNPLEFMEPGRLSALMDGLSAEFDWVVIDSPPVLPLADTSMWMRLADAIILVTRPGVTTKRQLQQTLETLEQSKLLGAILNASSETAKNSYYYHYATHSGTSSDATSAKK